MLKNGVNMDRYANRTGINPFFALLFFFCLTLNGTAVLASKANDEVLVPFQVEKGTNLITLARDYCHDPEDWRRIARINELEPPYVIYTANELNIPLSLLRTENLTAQAVTVHGQASLQKADGSKMELSSGGNIQPGDTVITGKDSYVQIIFPNNAYTRVEPNSKLTLTYLFRLENGRVKADLLLNQGNLVHRLDEKLRFNDSFNTRTPVVITGIRGTEFRLKTLDSDKSTVETLRGDVYVQARGKGVHLVDNHGMQVSKYRELGKPQLLPDPPSFVAAEAIYRVLPIEFTLQVPPVAKINRVRLTTDQEGQDTVYAQEGPVGSPIKITDLPDGKYFAFSTEIDKRGFESRQAGPHSFLLRTVPAAPFTSVPGNDDILWGVKAEVSWLGVEQAEQYFVQIARDKDFKSILEEKTVPSTSYTKDAMTPGQYYFRVRSVAADGFYSNFSQTVGWEQKEAPELGGMENTADVIPVLQWAPLGKGWGYHLQVANDPQFSDLIVDQKAIDGTRYAFTKKLEPGQYYVHLRGVENGRPVSSWTPAQTMTIKNEPKNVEGSLISVVLLGLLLL